MTCPNCGAQTNSPFCPHCGAAQTAETAAQQTIHIHQTSDWNSSYLARCPRCHSSSIHCAKRGYSFGWGLLGFPDSGSRSAVRLHRFQENPLPLSELRQTLEALIHYAPSFEGAFFAAPALGS